MFQSCFCSNRQYFFVYTNGNSSLNSFQLRNFSLYLNSQLFSRQQTITCNKNFKFVETPLQTCAADSDCKICLSPGSSGGSYQYSTNTFIYSLKNYRGYGYFKNDVSSYQHATYDYYGYGPTFGGGHDIYIADNARYNSNSYFYCSSYSSSYCDNSIWTGGMYFSPQEVEVYYEMLV